MVIRNKNAYVRSYCYTGKRSLNLSPLGRLRKNTSYPGGYLLLNKNYHWGIVIEWFLLLYQGSFNRGKMNAFLDSNLLENIVFMLIIKNYYITIQMVTINIMQSMLLRCYLTNNFSYSICNTTNNHCSKAYFYIRWWFV